MSKRGVEAAVCLGFTSRAACRHCRSRVGKRVEVDVEAVSKPANFDTKTGGFSPRRTQMPRQAPFLVYDGRWNGRGTRTRQ